MQKSEKNIIGRIEQVNLPEWSFKDIKAKIDTGAYTSSLHCHHTEIFRKNNQEWVRFYLLDPDHEAYNSRLIEKPVLDIREVKSSNGTAETRHFVETTIQLFGQTFPLEISLSDRSSMKYPLLLGRKFIKRAHFLVDVSEKNLSLKFNSQKAQ